MADLAAAAESLTGDNRDELLGLIDSVNEQLRLAVEGRAENGWSTVEVVDYVSSLCEGAGEKLISWIVQP